MANASNARVAADKAATKTGGEKDTRRVVEKRRALGRGLESLLPKPRVVAGSGAERAEAPATPSAAVVDLHVSESSGEGVGAELPPKQSFHPQSPQHAKSARDGDPGLGGAPSDLAPSDLASPAGAELERAGTPTDDGAEVSLLGTPKSEVLATPVPAPHGLASGDGVVWLAIDSIDRNPYQMRMNFLIGMEELADSIRVQGVLQPIVVRPGADGRFTLILGERRLRAAGMAGLETIPAVVKRVSEQQAAEMTLVENLQRQDLNCVDMASAFAKLSKQFNMTQEEIGARVGVSRVTVANYMRLLTLPSGVLEALVGGRLTYSHARTLMQLADQVQIWSFAKKAIEEGMSVAKLEELVTGTITRSGLGQSKKAGGARWVDPNVKAAQRSLEEILGMRVRISDRAGRGKIVIEYATIDDFDRVVGMLGGKG